MAHRHRNPVVLTSFQKQGSLDMYLREVRSIRESRMLYPTIQQTLPEDQDTAAEVEDDPNALLLEQAGFGSLVTQIESGESVEDSSELDSITAAFPKAHAAAIRRRMHTLRSTIRSRQQNGKQRTAREDVRNLFHSAPATPQQEPRQLQHHYNTHSHQQLSDGQTDRQIPTDSPVPSPRGSPTPIRERNRRDLKISFPDTSQKATDVNHRKPLFSAENDEIGIRRQRMKASKYQRNPSYDEIDRRVGSDGRSSDIDRRVGSDGKSSDIDRRVGSDGRSPDIDRRSDGRSSDIDRRVGSDGRSSDIDRRVGSDGRSSDIDRRVGSDGKSSDIDRRVGSDGRSSDIDRRVGSDVRSSDTDRRVGSDGRSSDIDKRVGSDGRSSDIGRRVGSDGRSSNIYRRVGSDGRSSDIDRRVGSDGSPDLNDSRRVKTLKYQRVPDINSSDGYRSPGVVPSDGRSLGMVSSVEPDDINRPGLYSVLQRARGGSPRGTPTPPLTPQRSVDSPMQEDIKLHFGSPSHSLTSQSSNGSLDQLPNFTIQGDRLGITHISDLSLQDLEKVHSLALLELSVTFDDHSIPLRPRRPAKAKNYPEDQLFGVPLQTLLVNDRKREPQTTIPIIFQELVSYLEENGLREEGLLRIPGSTSRVNALQQEMEANFNCGRMSLEGTKVSDVASLFKQFLRDLPVPLLSREHLPAFASIADIEDLKEQVRTLNLLILLLPQLHQRVLKRLLEFCEQVCRHSDVNKMDLTNVAMVIAPNLFVSLPYRQSLDDVTMAAKTSHVVRLLIKYHSLLWTVPSEMLKQVRYLYEADLKRLNQRSVQRALRLMQTQQAEQQATGNRRIHESEHHIIRVKAPLFTRVCMAVNISVDVTAGDIVEKLQKRSRLNKDIVRKRFSNASLDSFASTSSEDSTTSTSCPPENVVAGEQFLFEVGGNIGERCLPNDTNMYAIHSVNPNAQWVVKPRDCPDLT